MHEDKSKDNVSRKKYSIRKEKGINTHLILNLLLTFTSVTVFMGEMGLSVL